MTEKRKNLLFIAVILALAAVLWLAAHHGGTGRTAVLRYGDPQVEQRIDLRKTPNMTLTPACTRSTCGWKTAASPL
ncbi:hypothetical protein NIA69_23190 [Gemmiger formicilis]|nr:hypothetical protein [Gemmiger formicilis]